MAKWVQEPTGLYSRLEQNMKGVVYLDGEVWRARLWVYGDEIYRAEWDGRDIAFRNINGAMKRAVIMRKYDSRPPCIVGDVDETDDDE